MHVAVPLAARSEHILELSTADKDCNCAGVVGGETQAVPMAWGRDGRWRSLGGGRRAGFAAAPRVLNCGGIHGDKLLSCLSSARKPSM